MRTIVLVRHGETVGNSSVRYFGRTDLELSELGRAQMRAARRRLRTHFGSARFAPVITSPLRRAMESATIIAGPDGSIVEIEEFVEVDFGRFEGLTAEEIAARYPTEFERWNSNRLDPAFSYPGGESRRDFIDRVERGIQRMLSMIGETSHPPPPSHTQPASRPPPATNAADAQPTALNAPSTASDAPAAAARAPLTGADAVPTAADDSRPSVGEVALVVAHRGVIRIVCKRLSGAEPQIDLGSIQILERDLSAGVWLVKAIDIVEHLSEVE
jgi:broad specificity phosphatase PhoE